jgi:hypothetical protein
MGKAGGGPGFAQESAQTDGVRGRLGIKNLESYGTSQTLVLRKVYLAHAAFPEEPEHPVMRKNVLHGQWVWFLF